MEPKVLAELAELVEQREPEVPVTSGPGLPAAVEAGTVAASAGTLGGRYCCCWYCWGGWRRGRVLLPEATGTIFLFLSSISKCLRSVLSALSTRWLKSSKQRLSSAYWR